jgi:hypothetical protein
VDLECELDQLLDQGFPAVRIRFALLMPIQVFSSGPPFCHSSDSPFVTFSSFSPGWSTIHAPCIQTEIDSLNYLPLS